VIDSVSNFSLGFDPVEVVQNAVARGDLRLPPAFSSAGSPSNVSRAKELRIWRLNHPKEVRRHSIAARKKRIAKGLTTGRRGLNGAGKRLLPVVKQIQILVSNFFEVGVDSLCSNRRSAELIWPRHVAMFLCRVLTEANLTEVGDFFGGRDHTTVVYATKQVRARVAISARARSEVELLKGQAKEVLTTDGRG